MTRTSLALLLLLSSIGSYSVCLAQEYRYELGVTAGPTGYLGDANPKIPFAAPGVGTMLQARYNFNFRMVGYIALGYQLFRGSSKLVGSDFIETPEARFATSTLLVNPAFEYNFYPYSDKYPYLETRKLTPYVSLGLAAGLGFGHQGKLFFIPGLTGGIGLKYKVANRWNLQLLLGGMHFFTDKLDTAGESADFLDNPYALSSQPWKGNDGAVMLFLGISYEFGRTNRDCHAL